VGNSEHHSVVCHLEDGLAGHNCEKDPGDGLAAWFPEPGTTVTTDKLEVVEGTDEQQLGAQNFGNDLVAWDPEQGSLASDRQPVRVADNLELGVVARNTE
jgi:hypothetical protein